MKKLQKRISELEDSLNQVQSDFDNAETDGERNKFRNKHSELKIELVDAKQSYDYYENRELYF
jgi:hypothetical protein